MNRRAFEAHLETQLAPTLQAGHVVIPDNLSSHKGPRVAEILRVRGAWPLYLPPYSPDLNPIENAFAKLKELLRKRKARKLDALCRAMVTSARSSRQANAKTNSVTPVIPIERPML